MTKNNGTDGPTSGMGFLAYMAVALVVVVTATGIWQWRRTQGTEGDSGTAGRSPLPRVERSYAAVTPVPLGQAEQPIPFLDDDARQFRYVDDPSGRRVSFPGYVYALARMATVAGRPTRVWEAAVLSRAAFEFHYHLRNPLLSDLFVNRAVTLFLRNAGLEHEQFESQAAGPRSVDEAVDFIREHLAAGRPVLYDHYEWGVIVGEERAKEEPQFVLLGSDLSRVLASDQRWRQSGWWLREGLLWVHNLVAVTAVYQQDSQPYEAGRAALAASVLASRGLPDTVDLPAAYEPFVRDMASGFRAYEEMLGDLEGGKNLDLWYAGFPIQRIRFGRHAAAVYFRDRAQQFSGVLQQKLTAAADAFYEEHEAWSAYLKLGQEGTEEWRRQKAQWVRKAARAYQNAIRALEEFYVHLTTDKNSP